MSNISPEYLIERKKTKSQLLKWKFAALIAVIFCVFLLAENSGDESTSVSSAVSGGGGYVASIEINEIILEDLNKLEKLSDIAEDDRIKAVIVHINSPGGSAVGSELIYEAFRKISQKKPIVSVMGTVAASGGYMIALGTDYIFCQNSTITGSIGVLMQMAEFTELAEYWGIKLETFKSNELKAAPNPLEKVSPKVRQVTMETVYDTNDFFLELVAKHRKMNPRMVEELADGRIYTGRQALKNNLVDEIGFQDDALMWLQEERGIDSKLKVRKYKIKRKVDFLDTLLDDLESRVTNIFSSRSQGLQSIYN